MKLISPLPLSSLYAALLLSMGSSSALAEDIPAEQIVREPPAALLWNSPVGPNDATLLKALPPVRPRPAGTGNEVFYELGIEEVESTLFNPDTRRQDKVKLRAFTGPAIDPQIPYIGPKVELWPGETFRLTLNNQLPANDPSCTAHRASPNGAHCFNSTNMHSHGLWVSPSGNSDNVLLKIDPGQKFQYEYNIPADHPAGTFWYHPHLHGSTALQVSSGMVGPLIIRGDRLPSLVDKQLKTGDIDTLLTTPEGKAFKERTLVFQQIGYACWERVEKDGKLVQQIKKNADGHWVCSPSDTGTIGQADVSPENTYQQQFGPTAWATSGRHTAINGQTEPYFTNTQTGVPERWRMIHAGVRDTIQFSIRKLDPAKAFSSMDLAAGRERREKFIQNSCTGEAVTQFAIAQDGLTLGQVSPRTATTFQPGYREDLLMVFQEPGTYCIIDETLRPEQTVNRDSFPRELLGFIRVDGALQNDSPQSLLTQALNAAAKTQMPEGAVREQVLEDLADDLKLTAFIPHPSIAADEVTGQRTLGFRIVSSSMIENDVVPRFEVGEIGRNLPPPTSDGKLIPINSQPYQADQIQRQLELGAVDEWKLTSFAVGHPFHIHVNPFQIISVTDPSGKEVSGPPEADANGIPSQYANMQGTWRDTIFVEEGHMITIRSRYRRYIGDFVLHCHILDHEDSGMMQNVRISLPGAPASALPAASHH